MSRHLMMASEETVIVGEPTVNNKKNWTPGAPSSTFFHDKTTLYENTPPTSVASPKKSRSPRFFLDVKSLGRSPKPQRDKEKKAHQKKRNDDRKKKDELRGDGDL